MDPDVRSNDLSLDASPPHYSSKIVGPILVIFIIGIILILWDREHILLALRRADWRLIPPALFLVAFSYLCVSYTYAIVGRMWGIRMSRRALTEICFVTTSLNHVVRSGGVAGYTVRYLLMKPHGISLSVVISSSLVHYYLTSLDMLIMLPVAMAYFLLNTAVPQGISILLGVMTGIFVLIAIACTMLIIFPGPRTRIIHLAVRFGNRFLHRNFSASLEDFSDLISEDVQVLGKHKLRFASVMSLTFVDWISSVIVLSLCYDAFGPALPPGAVVASFTIGIMAGVISALPGGIAIQEGSMTGISMLLGASFEQAILAALLFRVVYYFLPYAVSPFFYWHLLRRPAPDLSA
jgi:glycosyltransferase 2 family protein